MSGDMIQTAIVTLFAVAAAGTVIWKVVAPWRARRSQIACGKCDSPGCGMPAEKSDPPLIQIQGLRK
jgi:hypothetical protein